MKFEYSLQEVEQYIIDDISPFTLRRYFNSFTGKESDLYNWRFYVVNYFKESQDNFLDECNQYRLRNVFIMIYCHFERSGTNYIDLRNLVERSHLNLIHFLQEKYPDQTFYRLVTLDAGFSIAFLIGLGINFIVDYIYSADTQCILMKNRLKYTASWEDNKMKFDVSIDSKD